MQTTEPEVTRAGFLDMQVCVPASWTDEKVKQFADSKNLCGTQNGWQIRRQGDEEGARNGCPVQDDRGLCM